MSSKKKQVGAKSAERARLDRDHITSLIDVLRNITKKVISKRSEHHGVAVDALDRAESAILANADKRDLALLRQKISAALRAMPEDKRPRFKRMAFYIWVADNVTGAKKLLPLIDSTGTCPDNFMNTIRDRFNRAAARPST